MCTCQTTYNALHTGGIYQCIYTQCIYVSLHTQMCTFVTTPVPQISIITSFAYIPQCTSTWPMSIIHLKCAFFSHFISYLLISYYTYLHIFCSLCEIYHMNVHKYVYHKPCLNGWPILYTSSNTPTYVSLLLKYITYTTPTHSLHLFHTSHRHVLCE